MRSMPPTRGLARATAWGLAVIWLRVDDATCHAGTVAWAGASRARRRCQEGGRTFDRVRRAIRDSPLRIGLAFGVSRQLVVGGRPARHPFPLRFPSGRTGAHCPSGFLPSQEWRLDGAGTMMRRAGPFDWCLLAVETAGGTAVRATFVPSRSVLLRWLCAALVFLVYEEVSDLRSNRLQTAMASMDLRAVAEGVTASSWVVFPAASIAQTFPSSDSPPLAAH